MLAPINRVEAVGSERAGREPPSATPSRAPPFLDIFRGEYPYVIQSIRRLGVNERDVEDVAHEVFLVVHRRLGSYDSSRALRPWLFGIAYRAASDFRRLARHHREVISDKVEAEDGARSLEDQLFAHQARDIVLRALDALEIDRRAVFVMCDIDGTPVPEIASSLGIPLNTAYSRLRLARAQFVAAVQEMEPPQP